MVSLLWQAYAIWQKCHQFTPRKQEKSRFDSTDFLMLQWNFFLGIGLSVKKHFFSNSQKPLRVTYSQVANRRGVLINEGVRIFFKIQ